MASVINQIKLGSVEYAIAASAYAECSTAAGTAAKTATICTDSDTSNTAFTLIKGVSVIVKFNNTNTAESPTLNINSSGAKAIFYNGTSIPKNYIKGTKLYQFVYDGSYWQLVADKSNLFVQADEPSPAPAGSIWVDLDDELTERTVAFNITYEDGTTETLNVVVK